MEITHTTAHAPRTAATTPEEGVALQDYPHNHHQALLYTVVLFADEVPAENTKRKSAK